MNPATRSPGCLWCCSASAPAKIASPTTDDLITSDGHTTLTFGTTPVSIPEPLASHLHQLARQRRTLTNERSRRVPATQPLLTQENGRRRRNRIGVKLDDAPEGEECRLVEFK